MRDRQIDLLRFLGLSLIILAHVDPPGWIFQLRNFDVPLVILVSGMALQHTGINESYASYVWKRIKRLVFPCWLFLTAYFLFIWATRIKLDELTYDNIAGSYMLMEGIGFVWIIRIFLLVALAAPFIFSVSKQIRSNQSYLVLVFITYLAYEVFLHFTFSFVNRIGSGVVSSFLYYGIAFPIVFSLGVRLNQLTIKEASLVALSSFLGFVLLGYHYYLGKGHIIPTQDYKYPPSAYYLSYAIVASIIGWMITRRVDRIWTKLGRVKDIIIFIAQNSLWVYLWHIFFLKILYQMPAKLFLLKYVLVYSAAVLITYIQVMSVQKQLLPLISDEKYKKNLKFILTG